MVLLHGSLNVKQKGSYEYVHNKSTGEIHGRC